MESNWWSIYNSRDDFEKISAQILGEDGFNSHNKRQPSFGTASDSQGPEPGSFIYYKCNNNEEFIFIGLEKVGVYLHIN